MNSGSGRRDTLKTTIRSACWGLYGRTIRNPDLPAEVIGILYVCKGNIVRSPFAELYSNRLVAGKSEAAIPLKFSSAGLVTPDTKTSPEEAVRTAAQYDVSMREHRSRLINCSMVESRDLVVAMDVWQLELLKRLFPEHERKMVLLPLYDRERDRYEDRYWKYNIADPYGKGIEHYVDCYRRMSVVLRNFIDVVGGPRKSE